MSAKSKLVLHLLILCLIFNLANKHSSVCIVGNTNLEMSFLQLLPFTFVFRENCYVDQFD